MLPIVRLARLDATGWLLLAQACFIVPLVRVALTVLPFRIVHRALEALARRVRRRTPSAIRTTDRITWAVTAVAARVPRASCLTQALAATLMLECHGHASTLRLGVAKNDDGSLRAHAWLESEGRPILGEPKPGQFTAFPPVAFTQR